MVTVLAPPHCLMEKDSRQEPEVVVACVTYNSAAVIRPFLAALPAALASITTCRVVIVDNASSDDTVQLVQQLAPWAQLIASRTNAGYAAGINLALGDNPGRVGAYVLNPDAVPAPGSIATLLGAVRDDPRIGIAVPTVLTAEGTLKFSLRREPTILRAAGEALLGGHRAARFATLGDMIRDPGYYRDGATADWATGAALFISRAAIDQVGGWDERFFLYSEETDYALRVRDAGFRLQLVPGAAVSHPGGDMEESSYLWSLVAVNRTRLYRKRHHLAPSAVFWAVALINEATRALLGREKNLAATKALLSIGPNQPEKLPTSILMQRRCGCARGAHNHRSMRG